MLRIVVPLLILVTCSYGVMHSAAAYATSQPFIQHSGLRTLAPTGQVLLPHHTESSIVPQQGSGNNLLQDGGFEAQGTGWSSCGNVTLVDAQEFGPTVVRSGRYAIAMAINADGSGCPQLPDTTTPRQILAQQLTIPATAPAVTVSFWLRAVAGTSVELFLAQGLYQFDPSLGGVFLGRFGTDQPPGWQQYRTVLRSDQLAQVRGRTLNFAIVIQSNAAYDPENALLLIDDVQILTNDGRTVASPLPPALRGDGSRPLAVIKPDSQGNRWLYRMDLDGGNQQLIYQGLLGNVRFPAWSPDGRSIAVADNNTWPWPVPDPDPQNNLSATAITVLNADGSNPRQIHQTQSRKGSRCPFVPTPGEQTERPSLLIRVSKLQWTPDGNRVAFVNSALNVFCDGRMGAGLADLLVSAPPATPPPILVRNAINPSLNRNQRLLFEGLDLSQGGRARGIWEADLSVSPPRETHLLPHPADTEPVWSRDGQRFAVVRTTTSPSADVSDRTQAIMIYNRNDLEHPQQVLFGDHGRLISRIDWSPDGRYLVYTLEQFDGRIDIWWLEIASGATGPVTSDGRAFEAAWRPVGSTTLSQRLFLPSVRR